MSAVTDTRLRVRRRRPPPWGVLASEWVKARSTAGPWWTMVATVLAGAGLAGALAMFAGEAGRGSTALLVSGWLLAQLGPLVLGVLLGSSDYVTGTYRATFAASPRRWPVLLGQLAVTAVLCVAAAVLALAASAVVSAGVRGELLPHGGESGRMLVGNLLHVSGVGVLGAALGALIRRPAAAIVAGLLLVVVLDQLLQANPGQLTDTVRALLPSAGSRMMLDPGAVALAQAHDRGPRLGVWGGGVVLAAWVLATSAAAMVRLIRHDVR